MLLRLHATPHFVGRSNTLNDHRLTAVLNTPFGSRVLNAPSRCRSNGPDRPDRHQSATSTFALLLEAQQRGHDIFYYTPADLSLHGDRLLARGQSLKVEDKHGAHFELTAPRLENLADLDVVLLRQDPPFDMAYITTTYLLERIHPRTLVVNDPAHVRNAPEKLFVLDFLDLMPPTLVTRALTDVQAFRAEYKDIIIKPLYGNGGAAVFRIKPGDGNLSSMVELFQTVFREPFMVQEYRPEVKQGDKRIILVDGEIAGALNRVPQADETRSNLHVGGTAVPVELNNRDREICAQSEAGTEASWLDLHWHRRHRPVSHRDQCHVADRHPAGEGLRRQ